MSAFISRLGNLTLSFPPILFSLFFLIGGLYTLESRDPPEYKGDFPFVNIIRKVPTNNQRPTVLVLPVVSVLQDKDFEIRAHEQITDFFRRYNYLVPSFLETRLYLKQQEIGSQVYEDKFEELSIRYHTRYIVLLKIQELKHRKAPNALGLVTSRSLPRASLTAVGRKTYGEYLLKIYSSKDKKIYESSTIADRKDPLLGFWRSSKSLAMKVQKEVLEGLLNDFATKKILRAEGYILAPLKTYHPDAKGFQ